MPFDTLTNDLTSPIALYQDRRERAAALWRGIPPDQFDLSYWRCGTTACAIGWLANKRFDGWSWSISGQSCSSWIPLAPVTSDGAALACDASGVGAFFALLMGAAYHMFCRPTADFYSKPSIRDVTPHDVADLVLRMPYFVDGMIYRSPVQP